MRVLTINGGSSTVKFAVFDGTNRVLRGAVQRVWSEAAELRATGPDGTEHREPFVRPDPMGALLKWLADRGHLDGVAAVAHRVVHGGDHFTAPVLATPDVLAALQTLVPFAPLHQPQNIAGARAAFAALPDVPHVLCFDTAFHATMPRAERAFGLPREYFDRGVKRYGFHGLVFRSVVEHMNEVAPQVAGGRVLMCHLGSGASLCALRGGVSVATTMGLTPLDGLLMSTRAGALDPGAVLYLLREPYGNVDGAEHILAQKSGFLGASGGISADMRDLLASPAPEAAEAVELFCYRAAREAGAMIAAMEGLDAVAFSGGIGENAPAIRARVCDKLAWLGVALDPAANAAGAVVLSAPNSRVLVLRTPADEERVLAAEASKLVKH
jgi:acetate kinase